MAIIQSFIIDRRTPPPSISAQWCQPIAFINCTLPLLLSTHATLYTGLQARPAYCGGSVRAHSTVPVLGCFPRMRHCTRDFRLIPPTAAEAYVPTQLYPSSAAFHACDTVHGTSGSSRLLRRKRTCPLNCTLGPPTSLFCTALRFHPASLPLAALPPPPHLTLQQRS